MTGNTSAPVLTEVEERVVGSSGGFLSSRGLFHIIGGRKERKIDGQIGAASVVMQTVVQRQSW